VSWILAKLESIGRYAEFVLHTLSMVARPPFRVRAFLDQMLRQGVRALPLATVAGVFYGMVLALQMGNGLHRFGAEALLPQTTTLGLIRELVPMLVGLVIGSRNCAGIAAELAQMKVTQQLDAVRVMGGDPARELFAPRVVAGLMVLPLITAYTDVVAVLGAIALGWSVFHIGARYYIAGSLRFVHAMDFDWGLIKTAVFGMVLSLVACWDGMRAGAGSSGVGRATRRAVVESVLLVIVLDYVISRFAALVR
jgi:phospholipid/cholesterol/gamma-HCH transport system permease protein